MIQTAQTKPISKEDLTMLQYLDNREYQAKFLLNPDIPAEEDFSHMDKNLAITDLKHNPKLKIDEVSEYRSIVRGLHVLNNSKHYYEKKTKVLIGYNETTGEKGEIIRTPVFEIKLVKSSKFPKTFHSLRSEAITLTVATASRNGHRMKSAITNRLEKIESVQDKTKSQTKWGFNKKEY